MRDQSTTPQIEYQSKLNEIERCRTLAITKFIELAKVDPSSVESWDKSAQSAFVWFSEYRDLKHRLRYEYSTSELSFGRWVYFTDSHGWLVCDLKPQNGGSLGSLGWRCHDEGRAHPIVDPSFIPPADGFPYQIGAEKC